MTWCSRILFATGVVVGLSLALEARAGVIVVPPRPGQVGLAIQGQYGGMASTGTLGGDYGSGPGLTVRLRYRMRDERGIGLSFESQGFDARVSAAADTAPTRATIFTAGPEIYQMFGTQTRTTRMISLGAGLAKFTIKLRSGETQYLPNGDSVYLSAGAGIEHFFWQSWALDLSGRYLTVFESGKPNHDFQAAAGLIVYASY